MNPDLTNCIANIRNLSQDGVTAQILDLVDSAIEDHPDSAELWCLRGDYIQLCEDDCPYLINDALQSYQTAVSVDPTSFEAYESIGYFYDVFRDNFDESGSAFRTAISLGAGVDSFIGLARVLAQAGKKADALHLLSSCRFCTEPKTEELMREINSGVWSNG